MVAACLQNCMPLPLRLVHTANTDKTRLSCLVYVRGVNWVRDSHRQFSVYCRQNSFVQSRNAAWSESCLVRPSSNSQRGYLLWRHLEAGSILVHKCVHTVDKTKLFCLQYIENCLWLSRTQFTPRTPARQDSLVSVLCYACTVLFNMHRNQHYTLIL